MSSVPPFDDAEGADGRGWMLFGLVVFAAVLRLGGLGSQLWLDEMDALSASIRRPAAEILTRWPATTSHVFHDLCSHASVAVLGETAFALRLPAALFGVAGVAALFLFTEPVLGRRVATVAAALLAVSYHHVFYSQNARGYTALVFFALVAGREFLRLRVTAVNDRRAAAAYVTAAVLAAYSLALGVFVLGGHAVLAAIDHVRGRTAPASRRRYVTAAATAAALIAVLHAPFAGALLRFTARQAQLPPAGESPQGGPAARLGVTRDAATGLARGFGGAAGLAAAVVLAATGGLRWARRDATSLAVLCLPLVLELAALLAADVPLSPRYFAMALAPLTIAIAAGLVAFADGAAAGSATRPWLIRSALPAAAVLASAVPLLGYYRVPKQDFRGAIARVDAEAGRGDERIAVHYAARGICGFYRAGFQDVQALADLEAQERTGRRLFVVTTLERFLAAEKPALHAHIQASYRRIAVLPGTVGGADMVIYERDQARF
jgi:mannosyltransferase